MPLLTLKVLSFLSRWRCCCAFLFTESAWFANDRLVLISVPRYLKTSTCSTDWPYKTTVVTGEMMFRIPRYCCCFFTGYLMTFPEHSHLSHNLTGCAIATLLSSKLRILSCWKTTSTNFKVDYNDLILNRHRPVSSWWLILHTTVSLKLLH